MDGDKALGWRRGRTGAELAPEQAAPTGHEAATIHRLLARRPGGEPSFDADKPLDADLVAVDETSMVDVDQLYRIRATPRYNGSRRNREITMAASTSFRISDAARARLASRAAHEGVTATALLDQLIIEGIDQLDYPGIVFRGPAHDRRAALAAGPDVWEIIARLQELDGSEEQRISLLAAESDLHPRLIRIALDYAAEHPGGIRERIDRNRAMAERSRHTARQREALLA